MLAAGATLGHQRVEDRAACDRPPAFVRRDAIPDIAGTHHDATADMLAS
jgi:hypothetical protein